MAASTSNVSLSEIKISNTEFFHTPPIIRFPREGSYTTPSHKSESFKFKDYCPQIFHYLRTFFNINVVDYVLSVCNALESGENALETLSESVSEPESAQEASFPASSPLLEILSIRQVAALAEAGCNSLVALHYASDDDLEAVPGIGPATVRKIRKWLAGQ